MFKQVLKSLQLVFIKSHLHTYTQFIWEQIIRKINCGLLVAFYIKLHILPFYNEDQFILIVNNFNIQLII